MGTQMVILGFLRARLLRVVRRLFFWLVGLDDRVALRLEIEIKMLQGKGTGAFSAKQEAHAIKELLFPNLSNNWIILDVGANAGDYSAAILEAIPNAQIYAFEPSASARALLLKRFADDKRVNVSSSALGNTIGEGTLWSDKPGSGLASLTKRDLKHIGRDFNFQEEIAIDTLSHWNETEKLIIDVIKIDVEGNELQVLEGAGDLLETCRIVQFEFGGCNIDTRTYFHDFWSYFSSKEFIIYRLSPRGLKKLHEYSEYDECFSTTNYFAVNKRFLRGV